MRKIALLLSSFIFTLSSFAQVVGLEDRIALQDAASARLLPGQWRELAWLNDNAFVYTTDYRTLMKWEDGTKSTLLQGSDLLPEGVSGSPAVFELRWDSEEVATYVRGNHVLSYSTVSKKSEILFSWPEDAENLERSPSLPVAYTINHNLYVAALGDEEARKITDDGSIDIEYGIAAHRSEFGIVKGIFWSPDAKKVAFYRIDQSNIPDYDLMNYQVIPAQKHIIRYPMAGRASQQVTVGIYDLETSAISYLQTGEPLEQYLTNITWSPDGQDVYVAVVNRDQNHLWLKRFDANTGAEEATLFEETDKEYVEPEHGLYFFPDSEEDFLWMSKRDGWQHLYHYQTDGTLVKQVTKGRFDVTELVQILPGSESIVINSTETSPLEQRLYEVSLGSGKSKLLSEEAGVHSGLISPGGNWMLDSWSSMDSPWNLVRKSLKAKRPALSIHEAADPLANIPHGEMEMVTLTASDGTPLYARLIKPTDFDPEVQYPAIVYVYGGPHVQMVDNSWMGGASMFLYYLAEKGYVVWTLDNRGTPNRGVDFEQATFRALGEKEVEDQMTGVAYLKSLGFVDSDRVGVHGWSFGGHMTMSMLLEHPGEFKVGVAGGPVIDWQLYEVMYTERYMDTPETNPEGFDKTNLNKKAAQLEDKLLIIHGLQDSTVLPQHTYQFVRECVQKGKQVDYFPYPMHEHNVRGRDRLHLLEKISLYFDENL